MVAHILVIEDEPDLVNILEFNLKQEGCIPRSAMTGKEGIESAKQTPKPDLVILDLCFPVVLGRDDTDNLLLGYETNVTHAVLLIPKQQNEQVTGPG